MIYRSLIMPYLSYRICVWGRAAKSYISKLLVLHKRALRLIYFAPSDAHAIPLFIELEILPVNNYDLLWHGCESHAWFLERPSPFAYKSSFHCVKIHGYNTRHPAKQNYIRREVKLEIFKCSFSRTGAMLWNQISPNWRDNVNQSLRKHSASFYLRPFQIGMTMLKSTPWLN